MLSVIQQQLGGQPLNIASGTADEILSVLKNETVKNPDKKKTIEGLLLLLCSVGIEGLLMVFRFGIRLWLLLGCFAGWSSQLNGGLYYLHCRANWGKDMLKNLKMLITLTYYLLRVPNRWVAPAVVFCWCRWAADGVLFWDEDWFYGLLLLLAVGVIFIWLLLPVLLFCGANLVGIVEVSYNALCISLLVDVKFICIVLSSSIKFCFADRKKKEIEKLLNPIPNHIFDQLVSIGKLINDYYDVGDAGGSTVAANGGDDALYDDVGVAVEFEENEGEEEESDLDMVQEDEEDDDDDMEGHGSGAMQLGGGIDDDDTQDANEGMTLNVQDIDAYWLQRKISQAYEQQIIPQQSQNLAEEVLKILAEGDDREVETKLLVHLQFDKFSLIKHL
ncbi:hypothetical protein ACSBR1_004086 [Camellia fascicularis]